jgi:hypothetical protein
VVTVTLTEFLLARIAEDERVARDASGATVIGEIGNWHPAPGGDEWAAEITEEWDEWLVALRPGLPVPPDVMSGKWGAVMRRDAFNPEEPRADRASKPLLHAVRHDPRRVLADCAAKRRLIHWYGDGEDIGDGGEFLRLLATVYADHPDYRPEWRP